MDYESIPRVLVVDDSSTIRMTVKSHLRDYATQIELVFAEDGFEAIRQIGAHTPALILADVMMPRLSGCQLCAIVKNNPKTKNTPFFILSSKDGEVDKAIGRRAGADGYLIKPFKKATLHNLINEVLFEEAAHDF